MQSFNKFTLAIILSSTLIGCANIDNSYKASQQDFKQYEEISKQYQIKEDWWSLYQDPQLNQLVQQGLENNKDLAKAAIAVNIALYNANLLGADLVPTFSGSTTSTAKKNIETGGNSTISHTGAINVSYTLDLWRRLADKSSAAEWKHSATEQDLAATRLSLINAIVTGYYQLAYLNDAIKVTQESINYYNQINRIMQNKLKQGMSDSSSTDQAQQAVLTAKNTLLNYQTQQKNAEVTLRNLLNLKPNEPLKLTYPSILSVKNIGVNLNVPLSSIANRPDVKGNQYRLHSSFKDAKAMQKSWFPTITLGAGLSSSGDKVSNSLETPIAGGTVGISLPFLSWNTVKWNIKISEAAYETALVNFEQSITTALNDVDKNYFLYSQSKQQLSNLQETHKYNQRIAQYYRNRYNAGVSELREWLTAANTEKNSQLAILNAKYNLLQAENAVYGSMAGYFSQ